MWSLKQIKAENFLSYKNLSIDIVGKKTTLIHGINLTDKGVSSNGSGKSSILEVLCFGITGNSLRKAVNKELIRNDEKLATTTVVLENPVLKKTLKIERSLNVSKPSKVQLYEDDVLREDLKDLKPTETDKEILRLLEISYNDIINYYLISKEKYTSLLLSSDTQKKEVINRFSKANHIDSIFPQIDGDISLQESKINSIDSKKNSSLSKIELLSEQIEELKEIDIKLERDNEIKEIKESIEKNEESIKSLSEKIKECEGESKGFEKDIKDKEKLLSSTEVKKETIEEKIKNIHISIEKKEESFNEKIKVDIDNDIKEVNLIIEELTEKISAIEKNIRKENSTLNDLLKIEAGEIECPSCQHLFLLNDGEVSLDECKELIKESREKIQTLEEEREDECEVLTESQSILTELKDNLRQATESFNTSIEDLNSDLSDKKKELGEINDEIDTLNTKIRNLKRSNELSIENVNEYKEKIEKLEKAIENFKSDIKQIENKPNPIIDQIKKLSNQIKEQNELIKEIDKELEIEQQSLNELIEWKVYFKKFKSFLANQSLSLIEQQSNSFLKKMKSDNRVRIDGFRELSTGKLKEEISIEVSRDGLVTESFGKFSGGEKAKIDLACILSMQTLINSSCMNGGLDLLFCDEILESADDEAMNSIVHSLSGVDKTVLMIAHSQPNENLNCNKLVVQKKDGISKIIN